MDIVCGFTTWTRCVASPHGHGVWLHHMVTVCGFTTWTQCVVSWVVKEKMEGKETILLGKQFFSHVLWFSSAKNSFIWTTCKEDLRVYRPSLMGLDTQILPIIEWGGRKNKSSNFLKSALPRFEHGSLACSVSCPLQRSATPSYNLQSSDKQWFIFLASKERFSLFGSETHN